MSVHRDLRAIPKTSRGRLIGTALKRSATDRSATRKSRTTKGATDCDAHLTVLDAPYRGRVASLTTIWPASREKREQLVGIVQERYGLAREMAEMQVRDFEASLR